MTLKKSVRKQSENKLRIFLVFENAKSLIVICKGLDTRTHFLSKKAGSLSKNKGKKTGQVVLNNASFVF